MDINDKLDCILKVTISFLKSKDVIISLISGTLGAIVSAIIISRVTYKAIQKEKVYYIELEVITEKILNPLLEQLQIVDRRKGMNISPAIDMNMFNKIKEIFDKNTCWYFVINKKLKAVIRDTKNYAFALDEDNLYTSLQDLKDKCEEIFEEKYK